MDFSKSLILIVTLSSLLCTNAIINPIHAGFQSASVPLELLNLCKDTENPTLCARTILPTLHGLLDPYQALLTEVNATARHTSRALGIITRLMAVPNNSKSLSDCLSICKDQYENILDSVKETLETIATKDMFSSRVKFSSVISFQQTCQDTFKESAGVVFSFARQSKRLYQLAGNCLAIMEHLENLQN